MLVVVERTDVQLSDAIPSCLRKHGFAAKAILRSQESPLQCSHALAFCQASCHIGHHLRFSAAGLQTFLCRWFKTGYEKNEDLFLTGLNRSVG